MAVVPIFVSSTFQDFHVERDLIRHQVLPALDAAVRPYGATVDFVDLRWGVDTTTAQDEREANSRVIDVCLQEIERCRPLFVALVGDRYGWIPPAETLNRVIRAMGRNPDTLPHCEVGLSITALEVWFGAMTSDSPAIVCLRQRAATGVSTAAEQQGINWLRDEVVGLAARDPSRVTAFSYPAEDAAARTHRSHFAERLIAALEPLVLASARELAEADDSAYRTAAALARHSREAVVAGRDRLIAEVSQTIRPVPTRGAVLYGPSGIGKTATLLRIVDELAAKGLHVVTVLAGVGHESSSVADVIGILAEQLDLDISEANSDDGASEDQAIVRWWTEEFAQLPADHVIVIDGLDQLEPGDCRTQLPMLRGVLSDGDASVLVTTTMPEHVTLLESWGLRSFALGELEPGDVRDAATQWARVAGRRTLPAPVLDVLASRPRAPIWVRLAIGELVAITRESYQFAESLAESGVGAGEALVTMLTNEARGFSADPVVLAQRMLRRVASEFDDDAQSDAFMASFALTRSGLTSDALSAITRSNALNVIRAIWQLGSHAVVRDERGRMSLAHNLVKDAAMAACDTQPHLVHDAIANALDPRSLDVVDRLDRLWHCMQVPNGTSQAESLLNLPPYPVCRPVLREVSADRTEPWSIEHIERIIGPPLFELDFRGRENEDLAPLLLAGWDRYLGPLGEWLNVWIMYISRDGDPSSPRLRALAAMADACSIFQKVHSSSPWNAFHSVSETADYASLAARLETALDAMAPLLASPKESERALIQRIGAFAAATFLPAAMIDVADNGEAVQLAHDAQKRAAARGFATAGGQASEALRAAALMDQGQEADALSIAVPALESARRAYREVPDAENGDKLRTLYRIVAEANAFVGRTDAAVEGWTNSLRADSGVSANDLSVEQSVLRWVLHRNPEVGRLMIADDDEEVAEVEVMKPPVIEDVVAMLERSRLLSNSFVGVPEAREVVSLLRHFLIMLARGASAWSTRADQSPLPWLRVGAEAQAIWAMFVEATTSLDAEDFVEELSVSGDIAAALIDEGEPGTALAVCDRTIESMTTFLSSPATGEKERLDRDLRAGFVQALYLRAVAADEAAPKRVRWRARSAEAKAAWKALRQELELHEAMGWMGPTARKWLTQAHLRGG